MYPKCFSLMRCGSSRVAPSSMHHQIHTRLMNTASSSFKYSANITNKDCLRLAFCYGLCGTFCSYLSMNYDGKVLVFRWTVPTPERFLFFAWTWSLAGMAAWKLSWTKPDALIRAAASRAKYGITNGTQTTVISMALSFSSIAFWSFHFDVKDWQFQYNEWQKAVENNSLLTDGVSRSAANMSVSPKGLIEEEDEVKVNIVSMDEELNRTNLEAAVTVEEEPQHVGKDKTSSSATVMDASSSSTANAHKPVWPTVPEVLSNAYEPCRVFFMCNAPIWLISGNVTGVIAARILTNHILLNPVAVSVAMLSVYRLDDGHMRPTNECLS